MILPPTDRLDRLFPIPRVPGYSFIEAAFVLRSFYPPTVLCHQAKCSGWNALTSVVKVQNRSRALEVLAFAYFLLSIYGWLDHLYDSSKPLININSSRLWQQDCGSIFGASFAQRVRSTSPSIDAGSPGIPTLTFQVQRGTYSSPNPSLVKA